jgi:hypothetical protein
VEVVWLLSLADFNKGTEMPTYRYRAADFTPVATATDALVLTGIAGKTITISQMTISGVATAASFYDVYILKRTTANTGGTATNPTGTPSSSGNEAALGTISLYSANPTLGTGANIDGDRVFLPATGTPLYAPPLIFEYGTRGDEKPTLKGSGDSFCVNFNGQAVPTGTSLYISIEWQES